MKGRKARRFAILAASAALAINVGTAQAQSTGAEGFGDFVWADLNHDGLQQAGEPGIPGVTVNLYRGDDAFTGILATGLTDPNGLYFLSIGSGAVNHTWMLQFVLPVGYQFSPADQGGNDALDSDVIDALTGRTGIIQGFTFPVNGDPILTVDAGMFVTTTVPEPGTLSLMAAALAGLAGWAGRRRLKRRDSASTG